MLSFIHHDSLIILLLQFDRLKNVLLVQAVIQNVVLAATVALFCGYLVRPGPSSSTGRMFLLVARSSSSSPVAEGARFCFHLSSLMACWGGQGGGRSAGPPAQREDAAQQRAVRSERWPFRNYEPLNQRLEISRFPKTAAQGIWPGEILFMA